MSYENNPKRYWYSCRQVCTNGTRYSSGWCFGDDLEAAKNAALAGAKRTRELCPNSFTPEFSLTGTSVSFMLVQNMPHDAIVENFTVSL